jgi:YVTN family beta-propeller protein
LSDLIVCNTSLDSISKIDLENYTVEDFPLLTGNSPVGPSNICVYKNNIITANCYDNSISIINLVQKKEVSRISIGAYPNDVAVIEDKAFVCCSESNSVGIIDLIEERLLISIKVGQQPYSIEADKKRNYVYVANMKENKLSILDSIEEKLVYEINSIENPTKILLSNKGDNLFVCESYFGQNISGYLSVISADSKKVIARIKVGRTPIDICEDQNLLYISNFGEGSISIIDINSLKEIIRVYVGGMPMALVKIKENIYFTDYYYGSIYKMNITEKIKIKIASGREPNAIIAI